MRQATDRAQRGGAPFGVDPGRPLAMLIDAAASIGIAAADDHGGALELHADALTLGTLAAISGTVGYRNSRFRVLVRTEVRIQNAAAGS